ncbi:putative bifunctional diguanylate cyclase/phosphodiesterase [Rhodopila sp.]|uniref:putative bifunctional diguanylate cyclase/phosphodiesterase n=1 Tax=Rhodopila sp. TaxID=2480087 RepID=UPI003D106837
MREAGMLLLPDGLADGLPPVRTIRAKPGAARRGSAARVTLAAMALDHLPLAVAVLDRGLRLHYWNRHAADLLGVPSMMEAEAPELADVLRTAGRVTPRQLERITEFCGNIIAGMDRAEPKAWLRVALGRHHRIMFKLHGLGGDRWLLGIEEIAPAAQIAEAGGDAMLDALTSLSNRRHFNDTLRDVVRDGDPDTRRAVLMIDLDRFKTVNDTLGHPVGDALLCLVAQRLRRETRDDDLVARLGGDEFVILQPNGEAAEALAVRVVDILSRPFLVEGHVVNIGASVGIVRYPEHGTTAEDLMRHADLALYDAKSAGRLTWRVFNPAMAEQARLRRELETDLRKALTLGEFSLAYQPQFNVRGQCLTGFEALLRWNHPTRGAVPPGVFIPVAEDIGCIQGLGEWVLKMACQEAARWPVHLSVAVNVSPRQLGDSERLFNAVQSALYASGLPPARLEIEITESAIMTQEAPVLDLLHRLRGLGIRIAMDDFGTGYSSLSQLRAFPFDKIKIDRSFVSTLGADAEADTVIRAITTLGAGLGMTTIAEGVETKEQAALVVADGCTDIQGYLISRPVPATEIDGLMARYTAALKS